MKTFAKTIILTAAQVNSLPAAPITVITAPPTGYAVVPQKFIVAKISGTAVGSCADEPICLVYKGDTTPVISLDAVGADTVSSAVLSTGASASTYTIANGANYSSAEVYRGKAIDIAATGATIAGFDGTLQVTVLFNLVQIG